MSLSQQNYLVATTFLSCSHDLICRSYDKTKLIKHVGDMFVPFPVTIERYTNGVYVAFKNIRLGLLYTQLIPSTSVDNTFILFYFCV